MEYGFLTENRRADIEDKTVGKERKISKRDLGNFKTIVCLL